jgi:hypothetical protein
VDRGPGLDDSAAYATTSVRATHLAPENEPELGYMRVYLASGPKNRLRLRRPAQTLMLERGTPRVGQGRWPHVEHANDKHGYHESSTQSAQLRMGQRLYIFSKWNSATGF